jgi:hypothetical protein
LIGTNRGAAGVGRERDQEARAQQEGMMPRQDGYDAPWIRWADGLIGRLYVTSVYPSEPERRATFTLIEYGYGAFELIANDVARHSNLV